MHREDDSKFLLYIEPSAQNKSKDPINDELVEIMILALQNSKEGTSTYRNLTSEPCFMEGGGFKGVHYTECGERSSNCDYLLENGMITNSLAPYYLRYYRDSIPNTEMKKMMELFHFYKNTQ